MWSWRTVSGLDGVEQSAARAELRRDRRIRPYRCIATRPLPVDEVVKVMNIAKDRNYKLILATQP